MTHRLDTLRTITELAEIGGYNRRWLKSTLLAGDRELHGTLLTKTVGDQGEGKRVTYRCSIAALRRLWPEFGRKFASETEVGELLEAVTELRRRTEILARSDREVRRALRAHGIDIDRPESAPPRAKE